MVRAISGAGGNPDLTIGRCTIFLYCANLKMKWLLCVWRGGEGGKMRACACVCGGSVCVCGWLLLLVLRALALAPGCHIGFLRLVLSRLRWVFLALVLQQMLFGVDLLEHFLISRYHLSFRCLSLGLADYQISGAGGR